MTDKQLKQSNEEGQCQIMFTAAGWHGLPGESGPKSGHTLTSRQKLTI